MDPAKHAHIVAELEANDRVLGPQVRRMVWELDSLIQNLGRRDTDGELSQFADALLFHVREMETALFEMQKTNGDKWTSLFVLNGFDDVID